MTAGIGCLTGIARWKRARVRAMMGGAPVRSGAKAAVALAKANGGAVACWASRVPDGLIELAAEADVPVWWIEDGFVRSAGLGAALVQPGSLTLDRQRPYYDPRGPSDLEDMLQTRDFTPDELARARALTGSIVAAALTKYNLGGGAVELPAGRRIVLVPGQVEADRSVLLGGLGLTMAALLERVRAEEPDAFILYKPHPDVVAGLRGGGSDDAAGRFADAVIPDADLVPLLDRVDVVHTLTSLTGFEALLRGCEVVVHGQPFYAGWGLTADRAPIARRTRRRSLDELVAAALIAYPLYAYPATERPCEPEALVAALSAKTPDVPSIFRSVAARVAAWQARARDRKQGTA